MWAGAARLIRGIRPSAARLLRRHGRVALAGLAQRHRLEHRARAVAQLVQLQLEQAALAIAGFYVADQCVEVHRRLAREDADACERARLYVELRADERALALEALEEALSLRAANEDRAGCALGRRHWQLRVVWLQVKPWAQCEPVLQRPRQLVPFWHLYLPQVIFISVH